MTFRTILACIPAFLFAAAAFAADPSGTWTAKVPGRGDTLIDSTFVFQVDGEKLTGTVDSLQGKVPISDGKIAGETITFVVADKERGDQTFKGTVSGDEIKMTRTGRRGEPRPFTAKRAK